MFLKNSEILRFIESNQIRFIDLKFADLPGRWHHISIPATEADDRFFSDGIPFDSSSIPGLNSVSCGDMNLIPDISTGFIEPFAELPTLSFICGLFDPMTHEGAPNDPRAVAIRAEKHLEKTLDAESKWLPELEFYLFDEADYHTSNNHSAFLFRSKESDPSETGFYNRPHGGYHAIPPMDSASNIRSEMVDIIQKLGVRVRYHHHEGGPMGQNEIEIVPTTLVRAGDAVMIMKHVVRMVANKYGLVATFMPKPLFNEPGNGMHFHQFLLKNNISLFWDENGNYAHLSKMALSYIAGILDHAPSLVGITNPSTNSYKRLVPGFEAPTARFYGLANRCAAIRIPKYDDTPQLKRMEFRPPDATCNPYLAISAQLLAGIDGITRELDPTTMGFGPIDENIELWSEQRKKRLKKIPKNIFESLESLAKDSDYLTKNGVFDKGLIDRHIEIAKKNALDIEKHPTPREMELYFDI